MKDLKTIENGLTKGNYFVVISNGDFGAIYQFYNMAEALLSFNENKIDLTEDRYSNFNMTVKEVTEEKINEMLLLNITDEYYDITDVINNSETIGSFGN
jgi:cytochrome b involved in lipid metabolism